MSKATKKLRRQNSYFIGLVFKLGLGICERVAYLNVHVSAVTDIIAGCAAHSLYNTNVHHAASHVGLSAIVGLVL